MISKPEANCEVILALYRDKGIHFLEELNGIFAFALYDEEKDDFLIARDPIGVIPLYIGKDKDGKIYPGMPIEHLAGQKNLCSMRFKLGISNIRILFVYKDGLVYLLSSFYERQGHRNTEYSTHIPVAQARFNRTHVRRMKNVAQNNVV